MVLMPESTAPPSPGGSPHAAPSREDKVKPLAIFSRKRRKDLAGVEKAEGDKKDDADGRDDDTGKKFPPRKKSALKSRVRGKASSSRPLIQLALDLGQKDFGYRTCPVRCT